MLRRHEAWPRFFSGPAGVNNAICRGWAQGEYALTIAGDTIFGSSSQGFGLNNINDDNTIYQLPGVNRIAIFTMSMLGAADTEIAEVAINGSPAWIAGQVNTAGVIAAIVYGEMNNNRGRGPGTQDIIMKTRGTNASAVSCVYETCVSKYPYLRQFKGSTTAVDTVRSVTFDQTYFHDYFRAVATNDIGSGNGCAWTGTMNNIGASSALAFSTGARGSASTQNFAHVTQAAGPTLISTWDIASLNGVSLAAAIFNNSFT